MMRPFTAIGVLKRRRPVILSLLEKTRAPVSPSQACRRPLASPPAAQTSASEVPSVVVTMGEPCPWLSPHQAVVAVGGEVAPTRSETTSPDWPAGQLLPLAP